MNSKSRVLVAVAVFAATVCSLPGAPEATKEEDDVWQAFRPLVGSWKGEGSGSGSASDVIHEWYFVLDGAFLQLRTRSVPRGEDKPGAVHKDMGFLSCDTDRRTFVFRQFLSEGFVNTYDMRVEGGENETLIFEYRETESAGGMRARMQLVFLTGAEYEMVLELAGPGKEFSPCQTMRMTKVR